jgi:NAD(P)H-dependent FMN reductase
MVMPIVVPQPAAAVGLTGHRSRLGPRRGGRLSLATGQDSPTPPTLVVVSASYRLGTVYGAVYELLSQVAKQHEVTSVVPILTLPRLPHFDHLTGGAAARLAVEPIGAVFHAADAVLFCVAEYAEGLPSIVVNLLEWAIADGFLCQEPTGWINLATGYGRGRAAHAALERALSYAGADLVLRVDLPMSEADLSPNGRLNDPAVAEQLLQALRRLLLTRQPTQDDPGNR